jgi:hypothetical protein
MGQQSARKIRRQGLLRCILACDALACNPSVKVTAGGLKGIDVNDFDFDCDLATHLSPLAKDSLIL